MPGLGISDMCFGLGRGNRVVYGDKREVVLLVAGRAEFCLL